MRLRLYIWIFVGVVVAALFTVIGLMYYTFNVEPFRLRVNRLPVEISGIDQPVKLVHLADLHRSENVPLSHISRAVDMAVAEKPDLVCVTGDFVDFDLDGSEEYVKVLSKLSAAAPTYACLGNHDYGVWAMNGHSRNPDLKDKIMRLLKDSGIILLENRKETLLVNGQEIVLTGLGNLWSGKVRPENVLDINNDSRPASPVIVLSHNPDSKDMLKKYKWNLMLSGHTHGGQFRAPLLGSTPFSPVLDKSMTEGLHQWNGRQIHITRGVGNLFGARFNCRPEISVLNLQ